MKIDREEFIELVRDTLDNHQEDIIKDYENDIARSYIYVNDLPEGIFECNTENINSKNELMRIFADSLQIKYLYIKFEEALAEEFKKAGYIKEE